MNRACLSALLLAACYNPSIPEGSQQCSPGGQCPEGYTCYKPTNHCYKDISKAGCMPPCAGDKPKCDTMTLKCVACLTDTDCPQGALCSMSQCKQGCSTNHPGCSSDGGSCDVDLGICRGCRADVDCGDPLSPRCDKPSERCVPCLPDSDNCALGTYCAPSGGSFACVKGCKSKADCKPGSPDDAGAPGDDGGSGTPDGGAGPGGGECCNHVCIDLNSDPANCGGCGTACSSGKTCCSAACVDLTSDVANCGGCGEACSVPSSTNVCVASKCVIGACNPGFADCNMDPKDGCEVSLGSDPLNCGKCGTACPMNVPNAATGCLMGACGIVACTPGYADCDKVLSNGCEVDVAGDLKNCGACGKVCPNVPNGARACAGGKCAIMSCNPGFADCDKDPANGCEVNVGNDPKNCSACGNACAVPTNASAGCSAGACGIGACTSGYADCDKDPKNGCEVFLANDLKNCGSCNHPCGFVPNGSPNCAMGKCAILFCNPGFFDCNADITDGCEVDSKTDPKNCSGCGKMCPVPMNGSASCTNAVCGVNTCNPGFKTCNMGACATKIVDNPNACGDCNIVCPAMVPNGTGTCKGTTCVIASCAPGFADCDGQVANGCETAVNNNLANCGGCGKSCPGVPNGQPACKGMTCGIGACNPSYADCDGMAGNGCEVFLPTNNANCGACGKACGAVANGQTTCQSGACAISACNAGYADCDKVVSNGCEVNLQTDPKNCGACGKLCGSGSCTAGTCGGVTGSATVTYTGTSFGTVCNSTSYGCSSLGTMKDQSFPSPVPGLPRTVSVQYFIEGCFQGTSTLQVYINSTYIGQFSLPYNCTSNQCSTPTVSNFFAGGVPGYVVNGANTLHFVVTAGQFCAARAVITLTT